MAPYRLTVQPLPGELLADRGHLVIRVGFRGMQDLIRHVRTGDDLESETFMGCRFIPLMGEDGW